MSENYNSENVLGIKNKKDSQNHFIRSGFTVNNSEMLRNADISACSPDELVDLRCVRVNCKMPLKRRTGDFTAQVGNPYLFKVDDIIVKVEFGRGKDFSEMLTDIILAG